MPHRRGVLLLGVLLLTADPLSAQRLSLARPLDSLVQTAQRDSLDPTAQYELGIGYWFNRKGRLADSAFRRAIEIEPKFARGYLALSYLAYARHAKLAKQEYQGRVPDSLKAVVDEANAFYRRAFLIDPLVDLRVLGLVLGADDFVMVDGRDAGGFIAALINGFQSFWAGQYESAYDFLQRAYATVPAGERAKRVPLIARWYHGLAAAHVDQYDAAIVDFEQLLEHDLVREKTDSLLRFSMLPSNEVRYVLAAILQRAGRTDRAAALYQEVLTNNLGLYMAHAQLATISEDKHHYADAIAERQRALEVQPDDSGLLFDLGSTLARARRFAEARDALLKSAAANPHNPRVPYTLGQVQLILGEREAARASLERFVAIAPTNFGAMVKEVRQQLAELK